MAQPRWRHGRRRRPLGFDIRPSFFPLFTLPRNRLRENTAATSASIQHDFHHVGLKTFGWIMDGSRVDRARLLRRQILPPRCSRSRRSIRGLVACSLYHYVVVAPAELCRDFGKPVRPFLILSSLLLTPPRKPMFFPRDFNHTLQSVCESAPAARPTNARRSATRNDHLAYRRYPPAA